MVLSVVPMGTSVRPGYRIFPARVNTAVPVLFSVPIEVNPSDPRATINGIQEKVFTLFKRVGHPHKPDSARRGGLTLGSLLLPSIAPTRAVASPETKAPAPSAISIWKLNPLPT